MKPTTEKPKIETPAPDLVVSPKPKLPAGLAKADDGDIEITPPPSGNPPGGPGKP